MDRKILDWFLEGDVSIQYQTRRDLLEETGPHMEVLQKKILTEGWGAKFLEHRYKNGTLGARVLPTPMDKFSLYPAGPKITQSVP